MNRCAQPNDRTVADQSNPRASLRIEIRRASGEDLQTIMEIERASFEMPWPISAMVEEIEGRVWSHVVVAEVDGSNVGFMVYWIIDRELHLLNLATAPAWRRRGVARVLIDGLLDLARTGGQQQIILEVRASNIGARRLYERFGFDAIGLRRKYYVDNGEDALVMAHQVCGRGVAIE